MKQADLFDWRPVQALEYGIYVYGCGWLSHRTESGYTLDRDLATFYPTVEDAELSPLWAEFSDSAVVRPLKSS